MVAQTLSETLLYRTKLDNAHIISTLKTLTSDERNILYILHATGAITKNAIRDKSIDNTVKCVLSQAKTHELLEFDLPQSLNKEMLSLLREKIIRLNTAKDIPYSIKQKSIACLLSKFGIKTPGFDTLQSNLKSLETMGWVRSRSIKGRAEAVVWFIEPNIDVILQDVFAVK